MFKKLKVVSLSAIAVIMIAGCDKTSNPIVEESTELPKVSQSLKSFFQTRSSDDEESTNETIGKAANNIRADESQNELLRDCQNGGTMSVLNDFNQTALMQNPQAYAFNVTSTFSECIEDGAVTNGSIKISVSQALMRVTFLSDMVIEESEGNTTIKQDSFFTSESISDSVSIETTSMEAISAEHSYKSENFKTREIENENGSTSSYDVSGKQTIDGLTLIVDETYDASQTPMITDADGNLQKGGKSRYTNELNHTIMIEAIETNKIEISVDEDGDGEVDKKEVIDY